MNDTGIILAGGRGSRLYPLTKNINKHFLPVYNKPMIFYSLSILIYMGLKKIALICNKEDLNLFQKITSSFEKKYKIEFTFFIQKNPKGGIAESLLLTKKLITYQKKIVLILGDNFFYGRQFPLNLKNILKKNNSKSYIFLSTVNNPKDYGIAFLNKKKKLFKIIEKPKNTKSKLAVTGLYIFDKKAYKFVNKINRSKRGELEITSLNKLLLKQKSLEYVNIGRGTTWFDLGTYENIYNCSSFIRTIENRQSLKISEL